MFSKPCARKAEIVTLILYFSLTAPVMVKTEKSIFMVEEDSKVIIICTATGQPRPNIRWNKALGITGSLCYGDQLAFERVQLWNDGMYICNASNVLNTDSDSVKVTVIPKVGFEIKPPHKVKAISGSHIQLDCRGTRFSNVTWRNEYGDSLSPIQHELFSNGTLVLLNVTFSTSGVYVCNASTRFRSINASTLVEVHYRSCSDLKAADVNATSGNYYIDPDGEGGENLFEAYCDMRDKNGVGVTVIRYHKEQHVMRWCSSKECSVNVTYPGVSLTQLSTLTKIASFCEQYISLRCPRILFRYFLKRVVWWVSRDGKTMYYWGGATGYSGRCACGMAGTCLFGGLCNCVGRAHRWFPPKVSDEGILTDKFYLPVTQLKFSYNSGTRDDLTLGNFRCYGIISNRGNIILQNKNNLA